MAEFRKLVKELKGFQAGAGAAAGGGKPAAPAFPPALPPAIPARASLPPPPPSLSAAVPKPAASPKPPPLARDASSASSAAEKESVGTVFRRHAANGAIDVGQLRTALKELKLPVSTPAEKRAKEGKSVLDNAQFRALVKELKAGGPDATPSASVGDVFRRYDADSSGSLDIGELKAALSDLGLPVDTAAAAEVLQRYDEDRSGRIEMAEFRKLVKELKGFQAGQK